MDSAIASRTASFEFTDSVAAFFLLKSARKPGDHLGHTVPVTNRAPGELLVQLHRELEVVYCRLVTISTDNITGTNEYHSDE
jgi:hypothetical protein